MKKKKSFFKDWFIEYKNVDWPKKSQIASSLWVVLVFVIIISLFLAVIDFGLLNFFNYIFGVK
jgi:preprotein translocase subunit SecE